MFYKTTIVSAILVSSLATVNAQAGASNTIRFMGEISSQTCDLAINDSSTSTPIVLLQPAKVSELATSGSVANTDAKFKLSLKNCATATADTKIGVRFVANNHTASGDLSNTAASGAASNVAIRLLDANNQKIDLTTGVAVADGLDLSQGQTSASTEYTAQYVADGGAATAGKVEATVQYAITYQ